MIISVHRQIFCDFGENFVVYDTNGEQPISNMVASITKVNILFYIIYLTVHAMHYMILCLIKRTA